MIAETLSALQTRIIVRNSSIDFINNTRPGDEVHLEEWERAAGGLVPGHVILRIKLGTPGQSYDTDLNIMKIFWTASRLPEDFCFLTFKKPCRCHII